jgi:hypothetical protein
MSDGSQVQRFSQNLGLFGLRRVEGIMLAVTDLGSEELIPVLPFVRHGNQYPLVLATGSSKAAEIPLTGSFLSRRNGGMPSGSHRSW